MTIESKRATIVRLAAEAGLGQYLPSEPGLPGTWWGTDLGALERFFDAAGKNIVSMREIGLMAQRVDAVVAVAAEREACAQVLDAMAAESEADGEYSGYADYYRRKAAEIRARGAA